MPSIFRLSDRRRPLVIAGPCSAETRSQLLETALALAATGMVDVLRAGIWKPRTSPRAFCGAGDRALEWLFEARALTGLPVAVEVATAHHVEAAVRAGQANIENRFTEMQPSAQRNPDDSVKKAIYADIEALNREREERQSKLDAIHSDMNSQDIQIADIERAKQTILDFPRLIKLVDYEGKLQLLRRIIECVIVKDDIVHIFLKGSEDKHFFVKEPERSDVRHREPNSICYAELCDAAGADRAA